MRRRGVLIARAAHAAWGCASAHWNARVDSARYPLSLSPALSDADGRSLLLGDGLEKVGEFEFTHRPLGFVYGAVGAELDLSADLNRAVEEARGEGVVNLTVRAGTCGTSWVFPLNMLPFYPGCQRVTVSGIVVRRSPSGRGASAAAGGLP